MTQQMRTNYEQLPTLPIDNVSGIVYSTDQLSRPQQGRQTSRLFAKPHSHSAVFNMFQNDVLGTFYSLRSLYAKAVSGTQSGQLTYADSKCSYANVRKQIINNIKLRKCYALKEKQYGKKLNG